MFYTFLIITALPFSLVLAVMFALNFPKTQPVSFLYQTKKDHKGMSKILSPFLFLAFFTISICLIIRDLKNKMNASYLMLME